MFSLVLSPYFPPVKVTEGEGKDARLIGHKQAVAHHVLNGLDVLVVLTGIGLSLYGQRFGISFQARQWITGGTFIYSLFVIDMLSFKISLLFNKHGVFQAPKFQFMKQKSIQIK